jgi:3-oxoadipate enol-lactonase
MPIAVHHEVTGPLGADVVVLSNSLGAELGMWDRQLEALRDYRVVRYDLRGHGRSPMPDGPSTMADLGGDLVALLDRLDIGRASLAGVSLGGMVSLWTAAHHPERVDRLVPGFTSAQLGPPEGWRERAALVRAEGTGAVADAVVGRWFTPAFAAGEPELVRRLRDTIAGTPAEGYASCCHAIETMDLRGDLPGITAPTLVLAGSADPTTPPAHGAAIAEAIRGARLRVLQGAAHLGNVEQPDAYNAALLGHLEGGS